MGFTYGRMLFEKRKFCFCFPVRAGVIIMSTFGILLAGLLMILIWFEISSSPDMESTARLAFIVAGLVETFLFLASILGFIGAIVRKQSFLQAYAYFLYFHFVINLGVAVYFFVILTHVTHAAADIACHQTIHLPDAQDQCVSALKIATIVYIVIATIVLLAEIYSAVVVSRYLHYVKGQKRAARVIRSLRSDGILLHSRAASESQSSPLLSSQPSEGQDFNPYHANTSGHHQESTEHNGEGPPIEVGYGGGSWTHREIGNEEKAKLEESANRLSQHKIVPADDDDWSGSGSTPSQRVYDLPRYAQYGTS